MTAASATRARRRVPRGAYLVLALIVTAVMWSLFAPTSRAGTNSANTYAIAQGREQFLHGCAACHGLQAQGVKGIAPSLIGVGAAAVDFQVSTGHMPLSQQGPEAPIHRSEYTPTQISQLAAYIASLAPGPGIPDTSGVATANVAQGGELFRANCAQCHNFAGAGGGLDYGKYAPVLNHVTARQIEEAMITGPENMPVFGPAQFTQQQRNDIAAYVLALKHTGNPGGNSLGRLGPVPEGAVAWIAGIGACVLATMWIGSRV